MQTRWIRAQATAIGATIAAAIVAVFVVPSGGTAPVPLASAAVLRLVRQAPAALNDAVAIHFDMRVDVSGNGQSFTGGANLDMDPRKRIAVGTADIPGVGSIHLEQIGRTAYGPIQADQVALYNAHWVAVTAEGPLPSTTTGANGLGYLQLLAGADGAVLSFGHETVNGIDTTHYKVTLDLAAAINRVPRNLRTADASGLAQLGIDTLPIDVWLDGDGSPRQMKVELKIQGVSMKMQMDFRPSNDPVTVTAPRPDDVYRVPDVSQWASVVAGRG